MNSSFLFLRLPTSCGPLGPMVKEQDLLSGPVSWSFIEYEDGGVGWGVLIAWNVINFAIIITALFIEYICVAISF